MTAFLGIVSAFVARLNQAPAVSDTVLRARDRNIPETKAKAINVTYVGSRPAESVIDGSPVDWTSMIAVECYAKTPANSTPDVALDELINDVYVRLAQDPTLGGLVDEIGTPSIEADYDSIGQRTGWAVMKYPVLHRTSNNTLEPET